MRQQIAEGITRKTITLYDFGGFFLMLVVLGIPFGSIFDFLWNLVVISVTLPFLSKTDPLQLSFRRQLLYCFIVTIVGLIIDLAYFELTWDTQLTDSTLWDPAMPQVFQFLLLILPMGLLFIVNATLSWWMFRLTRRQAVILGGIMGFFTAPWVLPIAPYVLGWTI